MGVSSGPNLITNGLIAAIDPNNKKSTIWASPKGFINTNAWASGQTSSVTGYGANETVNTENARVTATDPWGDTSVVWETRASGDGNGDGGWNTDWYNVDRTKLYRFSVWMRRTSSTAGGTFYFGLYGTGGTWGVLRLDNGANEGNPYWECVGTGAYTQNQWYLYVGHCYPAGTTYTGRHPDSGYYLPNGTKYNWGGCNIGNDVKMLSDTNQLLHRTYHFYCGDNTTRLQFAYPRIDLCDGNEPTLQELLSGRAKTMKNLISDSYTFTMSNQGASVTSSSSSVVSKIYSLDATAGTMIQSSGLNLSTGQYTIIGAARYSGETRNRIISSINNNWLLGHWSASTENHYAEGWVSNVSSGANDTAWRILAASGDTSTDSWKMYVNGVNTFSNANGSAGPNGIQIGGYAGVTEFTNGEFGCLYVYNRVLSDDEILSMYNLLKSEYGITGPYLYYNEGNNAAAFTSNWNNSTTYTMADFGGLGNVTAHGFSSGPVTFTLTLNNLPPHSKVRYKVNWHLVDSLDNETNQLFVMNSTGAETEILRFTKQYNLAPSASIVGSGVTATWYGGRSYSYRPWANGAYGADGFYDIDSGYFEHTNSTFTARHVMGADQAQTDEAEYLTHVQVWLS